MPRKKNKGSRDASPEKSLVSDLNLPSIPGMKRLIPKEEKDDKFQRLQEMFQGTVEADVIHMILDECEWKVDVALDTLFNLADIQDDHPSSSNMSSPGNRQTARSSRNENSLTLSSLGMGLMRSESPGTADQVAPGVSTSTEMSSTLGYSAIGTSSDLENLNVDRPTALANSTMITTSSLGDSATGTSSAFKNSTSSMPSVLEDSTIVTSSTLDNFVIGATPICEPSRSSSLPPELYQALYNTSGYSSSELGVYDIIRGLSPTLENSQSLKVTPHSAEADTQDQDKFNLNAVSNLNITNDESEIDRPGGEKEYMNVNEEVICEGKIQLGSKLDEDEGLIKMDEGPCSSPHLNQGSPLPVLINESAGYSDLSCYDIKAGDPKLTGRSNLSLEDVAGDSSEATAQREDDVSRTSAFNDDLRICDVERELAAVDMSIKDECEDVVSSQDSKDPTQSGPSSYGAAAPVNEPQPSGLPDLKTAEIVDVDYLGTDAMISAALNELVISSTTSDIVPEQTLKKSPSPIAHQTNVNFSAPSSVSSAMTDAKPPQDADEMIKLWEAFKEENDLEKGVAPVSSKPNPGLKDDLKNKGDITKDFQDPPQVSRVLGNTSQESITAQSQVSSSVTASVSENRAERERTSSLSFDAPVFVPRCLAIKKEVSSPSPQKPTPEASSWKKDLFAGSNYGPSGQTQGLPFFMPAYAPPALPPGFHDPLKNLGHPHMPYRPQGVPQMPTSFFHGQGLTPFHSQGTSTVPKQSKNRESQRNLNDKHDSNPAINLGQKVSGDNNGSSPITQIDKSSMLTKTSTSETSPHSVTAAASPSAMHSWAALAKREPKPSALSGGNRGSEKKSVWDMSTLSPDMRQVKARIKQKLEKGEKVLVVLRGCPGSGKSTLAREFKFGGRILSTDDYFMQGDVYVHDYARIGEAHEWNQRRAQKLLAEGRNPVLIDNTNLNSWEMKPYVAMGVTNSYWVEIVEPDTWWRYKARELERRNTHGVMKEHIVRMLQRFEHNVTVTKILNVPDKVKKKAVQGQQQAIKKMQDNAVNVSGNNNNAKKEISSHKDGPRVKSIDPIKDTARNSTNRTRGGSTCAVRNEISSPNIKLSSPFSSKSPRGGGRGGRERGGGRGGGKGGGGRGGGVGAKGGERGGGSIIPDYSDSKDSSSDSDGPSSYTRNNSSSKVSHSLHAKDKNKDQDDEEDEDEDDDVVIEEYYETTMAGDRMIKQDTSRDGGRSGKGKIDSECCDKDLSQNVHDSTPKDAAINLVVPPGVDQSKQERSPGSEEREGSPSVFRFQGQKKSPRRRGKRGDGASNRESTSDGETEVKIGIKSEPSRNTTLKRSDRKQPERRRDQPNVDLKRAEGSKNKSGHLNQTESGQMPTASRQECLEVPGQAEQTPEKSSPKPRRARVRRKRNRTLSSSEDQSQASPESRDGNSPSSVAAEGSPPEGDTWEEDSAAQGEEGIWVTDTVSDGLDEELIKEENLIEEDDAASGEDLVKDLNLTEEDDTVSGDLGEKLVKESTTEYSLRTELEALSLVDDQGNKSNCDFTVGGAAEESDKIGGAVVEPNKIGGAVEEPDKIGGTVAERDEEALSQSPTSKQNSSTNQPIGDADSSTVVEERGAEKEAMKETSPRPFTPDLTPAAGQMTMLSLAMLPRMGANTLERLGALSGILQYGSDDDTGSEALSENNNKELDKEVEIEGEVIGEDVQKNRSQSPLSIDAIGEMEERKSAISFMDDGPIGSYTEDALTRIIYPGPDHFGAPYRSKVGVSYAKSEVIPSPQAGQSSVTLVPSLESDNWEYHSKTELGNTKTSSPAPRPRKTPRRRIQMEERPKIDPGMKEKFLTENWSLPDFPLESEGSISGGFEIVKSVGACEAVVLKTTGTYTHAKDFSLVYNLLNSSFTTEDEDNFKVLICNARNINHDNKGENQEESKNVVSTLLLDKGCSTEDLDVSTEESDMEFLQTCFPEVIPEDLKDIFQQCGSSLEWTVNILLDAGYEYNVAKETGEEAEGMGESNLRLEMPETTDSAGSLQSPPPLAKICSERLQSESIPFSLVEEKLAESNVSRYQEMQHLRQWKDEEIIEEFKDCHYLFPQPQPAQYQDSEQNLAAGNFTGLQYLLPRPQLEQVEENFTEAKLVGATVGDYELQESSSELDSWKYKYSPLIRPSSSKLVLPHSSSPTGKIVPPKSVAGNGAKLHKHITKPAARSSLPSQSKNSAPRPSLKPTNRNAEEEEEEKWRADVAETPGLVLSLNQGLANQLQELFGAVGYHLSAPGSLSTGDLRVKLSSEAARCLHQCWRLTLKDKFLSEEDEISDRIKEDEALAKRLQEEEDLRIAKSLLQDKSPRQALRCPKPGYPIDATPGSYASAARREETCSFKSIMDEEFAKEITKQQIDANAKKTVQYNELATKLKRQKLTDMFPRIDSSQMDDLFQANGYSMGATVTAVENVLGKVAPPRTVMSAEAAAAYEEQLIQMAKAESLAMARKKEMEAPRTMQSEFQTYTNPDYQDFRAEATMHYNLRHECFQKAQEAHRRGMKDVASFYSQQGHVHSQKLREANQRAGETILAHRNQNLKSSNTVDLHQLHVPEALDALNQIIFDRSRDLGSSHDKRRGHLFVITGRGNHSKGGVAKLKPAVIDYLKRNHLRYTEVNDGLLKLML